MGASPAAETARAYVARAADTHDPVLISAERGLDALAVCRAIHDASDLTAYAFSPIECRGQTAESFQRDLSPAATQRTAALRNIDELPAPLQRRLAEMLRDEAAHGRRPHARVMATLTRNVEDAIGLGKLSRDLCMRFPLQLEVPPLRRRPADIPLLIGCVAVDAAAASGVGVPAFTAEAQALLSALPWRRNLEELREVLDVLVLVGGIIPDQDIEALKKIGVAGIFQPGTPMDDIVKFIREHVKPHSVPAV